MPLKNGVVCPMIAVWEREDGRLEASTPVRGGPWGDWFESEGACNSHTISPVHPAQQLGWLDEKIAQVGDFLTKLKGLRERVAAKPVASKPQWEAEDGRGGFCSICGVYVVISRYYQHLTFHLMKS